MGDATVVVTLIAGERRDVIQLVFDGDVDDAVEYDADFSLKNQTKIMDVKNKNNKTPRGENMRSLMKCNGGILQYEEEGGKKSYKVIVREGNAITFVSFRELGGGKEWRVPEHGGGGKEWRVLERGEDFMLEAKENILREWGLNNSCDELHLACYTRGVDHRVVLKNSAHYWDLKPTTNTIFFWVGPVEDSPIRLQKRLSERTDRLEHEVMRLQAASSTAKDQMERWSQRSELSIEKVKRAFPSVTNTVPLK